MKRPRTRGTRFRLFPGYASGYEEPETVVLSSSVGTIGPGPSDSSMYTVNPRWKQHQYDPPEYLAPYRGAQYQPARPGPTGHFDNIAVETPQFLAAHLYGCTRRTLDIWEHYLGKEVVWWHAAFIPQLELVTVVQWTNAHSGPGFIETGLIPNHTGRKQLFCLNFDVIAHETGHAILFSQVGVPKLEAVTRDYLGFHESFSDLIGLISAMHFQSVTEKLLQQTEGNLYLLNLLNRLGETSDREQVRIASNTAVMDDVKGLELNADGTWTDPLDLNRNQHAVGEPLTGAIFDMLVEIYQDVLVARRLIHPALDPRGWTRQSVAASFPTIRSESARALARFSAGFHLAIDTARNVIGSAMAHVILTVRPDTLTFEYVAARMLEAVAALGQGHLLPALLDHFLWRGIDPRPYLTTSVVPAGRGRGTRTRRMLRAYEPFESTLNCSCGDPRAYVLAGKLMQHPHRQQPQPQL
jgi:hypothetical protein